MWSFCKFYVKVFTGISNQKDIWVISKNIRVAIICWVVLYIYIRRSANYVCGIHIKISVSKEICNGLEAFQKLYWNYSSRASYVHMYTQIKNSVTYLLPYYPNTSGNNNKQRIMYVLWQYNEWFFMMMYWYCILHILYTYDIVHVCMHTQSRNVLNSVKGIPICNNYYLHTCMYVCLCTLKRISWWY